MKWIFRVGYRRERRNEYNILVRKSEEKRP
jgi:hypothetical protein